MRSACFLMLAIATAAYADDPFACVDPDVADAFLGDPYRGRGEYSTIVPDGFVDLSLPAGWTLIGSQAFDAMTTVTFKTSMDRERAFTASVAAMARSGWAEIGQQYPGATGGFQTGTHPILVTVLCSDDLSRALSVIAAERSDQTFVSYVQHPDPRSCGAKVQEEPRYDPSELMRLVPSLKLPVDVRATNTGTGGNGNQVSSHVDVFGAVSRSDLSNFLENQIRDQGWESQTSWSSHHSSGSVWALDTVDDGLLIGTLLLFDSGLEPIRVRFSVTPADPAKGKDQGAWSTSSN